MGIISCGTTLIDQGLYQGLTSIDWDTTPKTATFTGVAGNGYFCNTSSGTFTLNLPAGSVGDIIAVSDYASTFNVPTIPAVYSNPESSLGTPDLTVSSVSNFSAPSGTVRGQDLFSAVDVGGFTASDYGVIWETGAAGTGFAASLEAGGELWVAAYDGDPWANSAMAYLKVDVSSYYNTPGTFYTTIDQSAKQFKLYFQPGGPSSGNQAISLGTSTVAGTTSNWAGTDPGALGQVNSNVVNFGFTNYNASFTGDAQELRWYYNTAEPSPFQSITTPAVTGKFLTISPNGTDKINGTNADAVINTKGVSLVLLYVDSTRGWKVIGGGEIDATGGISATGGTITTCGDYKIHSFTGPGTFTVNSVSSSPANNGVDYLVVAGGGGGASSGCGGGGGAGGAGGFRTSSGTASGCYSTSPLGSGVSSLPVSVTSYPITVGGGGAGGVGQPGAASSGSNSVFSTITSTGGGYGAGHPNSGQSGNGAPGGSGGGGGNDSSVSGAGGTGNTPPVSPPQGNPGGSKTAATIAGGGGGAGGSGGSPTAGSGTPSSITGSNVTYSEGGQGCPSPEASGPSNSGDGGFGTNGICNTAGSGGSGIVIIRYKFQ